jgi:UDP-GlcNAc:undecaprenyl-phosphate GlcNAc-1-phosphate transferase
MLNNQLVALISTLSVLSCLVASRAFGYSELQLLSNRIYHFCGSFVPLRSGAGYDQEAKVQGRRHMVRFQGNRSWETIWNAYIEFAEKHDLAKISLDLNGPWLHEGFHASWTRTRLPEDSHQWRIQLPVFAEARSLGRVSIVGRMSSIDSVAILGELGEMMEGLHAEILALVSEGLVIPIPQSAATGLPEPDGSISSPIPMAVMRS